MISQLYDLGVDQLGGNLRSLWTHEPDSVEV